MRLNRAYKPMIGRLKIHEKGGAAEIRFTFQYCSLCLLGAVSGSPSKGIGRREIHHKVRYGHEKTDDI